MGARVEGRRKYFEFRGIERAKKNGTDDPRRRPPDCGIRYRFRTQKRRKLATSLSAFESFCFTVFFESCRSTTVQPRVGTYSPTRLKKKPETSR